MLIPHHESVIDGLVRSGRYQNASEVPREGPRLIEARETLEAAKLQALKEAAQRGFADLDLGRSNDVPEEELEGFIGGLARRASDRAPADGQ